MRFRWTGSSIGAAVPATGVDHLRRLVQQLDPRLRRQHRHHRGAHQSMTYALTRVQSARHPRRAGTRSGTDTGAGAGRRMDAAVPGRRRPRASPGVRPLRRDGAAGRDAPARQPSRRRGARPAGLRPRLEGPGRVQPGTRIARRLAAGNRPPADRRSVRLTRSGSQGDLGRGEHRPAGDRREVGRPGRRSGGGRKRTQSFARTSNEWSYDWLSTAI